MNDGYEELSDEIAFWGELQGGLRKLSKKSFDTYHQATKSERNRLLFTIGKLTKSSTNYVYLQQTRRGIDGLITKTLIYLVLAYIEEIQSYVKKYSISPIAKIYPDYLKELFEIESIKKKVSTIRAEILPSGKGALNQTSKTTLTRIELEGYLQFLREIEQKFQACEPFLREERGKEVWQSNLAILAIVIAVIGLLFQPVISDVVNLLRVRFIKVDSSNFSKSEKLDLVKREQDTTLVDTSISNPTKSVEVNRELRKRPLPVNR